MHGGRVHAAVATVASAVALAAPASAPAAVYDAAGDCVDRGAIDEYERVDRRPYLEIYGKDRTEPLAERAADIIRGERIWSTLADKMGQPRRQPVPGGGREMPYQLFILNEPFDADGANVFYCGDTFYDTVVINSDLEGREFGATIAHELFHAFSGGVANADVFGWWAEAAATWAENQLYPGEGLGRLDRSFLQRPLVPIDAELADPAFVDRPYGGWRFVQWLEGYIGGSDAMWDFINGTLRRIGTGATNKLAVAGELSGRGRNFGEDLGQFWGDHLMPTSPLNGPRTNGEEALFPGDEPGGGEITEVHELLAKQLASDVVRLKLPRDSHVQRITFAAERSPPGTYLWVQYGRELQDWSAGDSATFCVGGASPTLGAKAWPGQFPLAFTNGNLDPPHLVHQLRVTVSAEECEGLVPDPAAAVDESPVLDLPDRCPRAPREFAPPPRTDNPADGLHTEFYVYRERLSDVYLSLSHWTRAAVARIENRDLSRRAATRLLARWVFCTESRVRQLDLPETEEGPDDKIPGWHRQLHRTLRRAAQQYERGSFSAINTINDAGLLYAQLILRATLEDIANAE